MRRKPRRAVKIRRKRSSGRRAAELRCKFLWSAIIRAPGKCEKCGTTENLQASHILPKGMYRRMRFDLENGQCLCRFHHLYWWHKSPGDAIEWLEGLYPGRFQHLKDKAATAPKVDLTATEEALKAALD